MTKNNARPTGAARKHARLTAARETKFADTEIEQVRLDGTFTGYASIFGEVDLGNDVVAPGAFAASLANRSPKDIRMLFQHDPAQPIGVWEEIVEDERGLRVKGRITRSTAKGMEVLELMRSGAIDGLSIGFRTVRARTDPATKACRILAADLWEISVVTFPMLEGARIESVKSLARYSSTRPTVREFEKWLTQDAGLSRSEARTVITKGYSQLAGARDAALSPPTSFAARLRVAANTLNSGR